MSQRRNLLTAGTAIGLVLVAGSSMTTVTARTVIPGRALSSVSNTERAKFPWTSHAARFAAGRIVVVWRRGVDRLQMRDVAARLDAVRLRPTPRLGVDVMRVPAGASVEATVRSLRSSPLVRFAEPDRLATAAAVVTPTDPLFPDQWYLDNTGQSHPVADQGAGAGQARAGTPDADVDAPEAWGAQTQHGEVVEAVIDTGVDIHHPDLAGRLWSGVGYDFVANDTDPSPEAGSLENAHGTHVAGIIAAEQNNGIGITGVCPDCRIMALKIGSANRLTLGNELKAVQFAIDNGAKVINLSFGSPVWSAAERAALAAAGRAGILVVAAAGNSSADNDIPFYLNSSVSAPTYPASYTLPNILAVAATNDRDQYAYVSQCRDLGWPTWRCAFTSWGHDSVDVAAPGVDILSTVTSGQGTFTDPDYAVMDGTSMASPLVAGIAGLVLAEHPDYTPLDVKNAIMNSVDRPSPMPLYDAWAGVTHVGKRALTGNFTRTDGRVNAFAAIGAPTTNATHRSDGNIDGARPLRGHDVVGRVSWPADVNDVYRERLIAGRRYRVVLRGPADSDLDLWVWKPGTKEIAQFTAGCFLGRACPALQADSGGPTANEQATFKAARSGTYYVQVNGWYSGGRYRLTVERV
ncbi:MAG: S8 family serine peptidase [Actinomycetota bacterium]